MKLVEVVRQTGQERKWRRQAVLTFVAQMDPCLLLGVSQSSLPDLWQLRRGASEAYGVSLSSTRQKQNVGISECAL